VKKSSIGEGGERVGEACCKRVGGARRGGVGGRRWGGRGGIGEEGEDGG